MELEAVMGASSSLRDPPAPLDPPAAGVVESEAPLPAVGLRHILLLSPQHLQVLQTFLFSLLLKYCLLQGVEWDPPRDLRQMLHSDFLMKISFTSSLFLFLIWLQSDVQ